MKAARILIVIFSLFLSYSSYSQVLDGKYTIHHVGYNNESQASMKYSVDAPESSSILFSEKNIFIMIGDYRVDILKYDDKDTDYRKPMAEIKAFSYLDNRSKTAFIQTLEKGMYSLWLERGNGGADIFLFTTPEYQE